MLPTRVPVNAQQMLGARNLYVCLRGHARIAASNFLGDAGVVGQWNIVLSVAGPKQLLRRGRITINGRAEYLNGHIVPVLRSRKNSDLSGDVSDAGPVRTYRGIIAFRILRIQLVGTTQRI